MSHEPPVSLWPDPNALGPVTDLYELTMMAATWRRGSPRSVRRSSSSSGRCPRTAATWSSRASSRRSATCFGSPSSRSRSRRSADGRSSGRSIRRSWTRSRPCGSRATSGPCPRGPSSSPARRCCGSRRRCRRRSGSRRFWWPRSPIRPWSRPRPRGWSPWPAAGRSRNSAHGEGTGRMRASSRRARPTSPASPGPATSRPPGCWASPRSGTMAHSWVQAFPDEPSAFAAFARVFGASSTLLVDTYDTLEGVKHAAAIEPPIQAIRIDSGDLTT